MTAIASCAPADSGPATTVYQPPAPKPLAERLRCLFNPDKADGHRIADRIDRLLHNDTLEGVRLQKALRDLAVVNPNDFEVAALCLTERQMTELREAPDWRLNATARATRDRLDARYSTVNGIELEVTPEYRREMTTIIRSMLLGDPAIARRISRAGARVVAYPIDFMKADEVGELHWYAVKRCLLGSGPIGGVYSPGRNVAVVPLPQDDWRYGAVHEIGHLIRKKGMSDSQRARLRELYAEAKACPYPFSNNYWTVNDSECFSVLSEIYFGVCPYATRAELAAHHPAAIEFLEEIYGPPPTAA
jgi:hypothetical protein